MTQKRQTGWLFVDPETGSLRRSAVFVLCGLGAGLAVWLLSASDGLSPAALRALFILVFAAALWVTEAVPAYSVGLLVIGLKIALLGDPEGPFATSERDWEAFVAVMGHPLIWLFFGGFVLAQGMAETGLDKQLAAGLLRRFGDSPPQVLLGVMTVAFFLSMFISNTATTAMMLASLSPLIASRPQGDLYTRGLLLGLATAANLGGMGSLIGTPPNAIAVGALAELEPPVSIDFLQWFFVGLPPALASLLLSWVVINFAYPSQDASIQSAADGHSKQPDVAAWQPFVVAATTLITLALWLTTQWHGIPAAAVAFLPIVVLTTTGVLGAKEIRTLNYDVLFLMAGGLALGQTVSETGLSDWIVAQLPLGQLGTIALALAMTYTTVLLSNLMSNTAAANVLIPIGMSAAAGFEPQVVIPIAFGASAAMCLPVATPPNAMVYATERCLVKDFLFLGSIVGLVTPLLGIAWNWISFDTMERLLGA